MLSKNEHQLAVCGLKRITSFVGLRERLERKERNDVALLGFLQDDGKSKVSKLFWISTKLVGKRLELRAAS